QRRALAVDGDLARLQAAQCPRVADPDAAIACRKNGRARRKRHSLPRRPGRNGVISEAIETVVGGYPDAPFTILKEGIDAGAGQPVRRSEGVRFSLVEMDEAATKYGNPQRSVAILEKAVGSSSR